MATSQVSQARRDAMRRRAEITSDYTLGKSRLKQDFRFTRSALDRALKGSVTEARDDFAGRGLYGSSIRKDEEADIGTEYAANLGLANQSLARELENLERSKTKGLLGISSGLEGVLIGSTGDSLAQILQRALNDARNRVR